MGMCSDVGHFLLSCWIHLNILLFVCLANYKAIVDFLTWFYKQISKFLDLF